MCAATSLSQAYVADDNTYTQPEYIAVYAYVRFCGAGYIRAGILNDTHTLFLLVYRNLSNSVQVKRDSR